MVASRKGLTLALCLAAVVVTRMLVEAPLAPCLPALVVTKMLVEALGTSLEVLWVASTLEVAGMTTMNATVRATVIID